MRYARLKDGVYKIIHDWRISELVLLEQESGIRFYMPTKAVIAKGDTIEELCDLFIKKSKEEGNDYFEIGKDPIQIFDKIYDKTDLQHYDYYGAIWTPKGLEFVAQMNKEKELMLI